MAGVGRLPTTVTTAGALATLPCRSVAVRVTGLLPRLAQVKVLRLGSVPEVRLTKPDGDTQTLTRGSRPDYLVTQTEQLGVHVVRWADPAGKGEQSRRFAVNLFDPLESDLAVLKEVKIGNATIAADAPRKQPRDLWKYPVLLGLLALVVEWWVYNKRVQI